MELYFFHASLSFHGSNDSEAMEYLQAFQKTFIQYIPWRAPRLKDTLSFCKALPRIPIPESTNQNFFPPSTLNAVWSLPPLPPHWWASHPANEGDYSGGKWDRDLSCHSQGNGHISRVITAAVGPGHDSVLVLVKVILLHFKLFSRWSPRLWSCLSYWWMLLLRL